MKTLIASTALAMALAAPGFAQTTTAPATGAPAADSTATMGATEMNNMDMGGGFVGSIENQALRASNLMGARLYVSENEVDATAGLSTDWEDVGEISDIIVGGNGEIDAVLVDIGGFLGIGERTVAVNLDNLQFVSDGADSEDFFIVLQGNRAALESAPEFNQEFQRGRTTNTMDVANEGSGLNTQDGATSIVAGQTQADLDAGTTVDNPQTPATAVVTEGGTTVTTTGEETATDTAGATMDATTAEENVADAINNADDAVTNTGTAVTAGAGDAAATAGDAVTDAATDVANATENAADTTGDVVTDVATDVAEGADATVTTTGDAATGAVAGAVATGGAMMGRPNLTREGYETVEMDALTTEDVTGAGVYDINDERVGEIGELVMTDDGQLQDAIIDVGGFLGLGEKPVAVSFESLQVLRGEGDVRVYVDTTQEQLESLPAYEN